MRMQDAVSRRHIQPDQRVESVATVHSMTEAETDNDAVTAVAGCGTPPAEPAASSRPAEHSIKGSDARGDKSAPKKLS
jgi:hypothetical protein